MIVRSTGSLFPNLSLITFGNSCHYILKAEKETILFDPGLTAHASQLIARLNKVKINPDEITKILITHAEAHRMGGLPAVRKLLKNAKLAVTPAIAKELSKEDIALEIQSDDRNLSKQFFASGATGDYKKQEYYTAIQPDLEIPVVENIEVDAENSIQIIETPGHTENSVSFYLPNLNALICDDVVGYFRGKDLPAPACDFSIDETVKTLDKLASLDSTALCLPHFGALTGDLVKKHFELSKQAITEITEECEKAWELGVNNDNIFTAIKESFYTTTQWDPVADDCLKRSLEKLWEQIS